MFKVFCSVLFGCFFVFTLYTVIQVNKITLKSKSWRNLSKEDKRKIKQYFLRHVIAFILLLFIALISFMYTFG